MRKICYNDGKFASNSDAEEIFYNVREMGKGLINLDEVNTFLESGEAFTIRKNTKDNWAIAEEIYECFIKSFSHCKNRYVYGIMTLYDEYGQPENDAFIKLIYCNGTYQLSEIEMNMKDKITPTILGLGEIQIFDEIVTVSFSRGYISTLIKNDKEHNRLYCSIKFLPCCDEAQAKLLYETMKI